MAIEDNKVYGLTGAQLKELPGKIDAVKGFARELTTDDYNYPTGSPAGVALWKLDAGVYTSAYNVVVYLSSAQTISNGGLYIVSVGRGSAGYKIICSMSNNTTIGTVIDRTLIINNNGDVIRDRALLAKEDMVNNLTTTAASKVLDARQGKALKDLIDALDTDLQSQIDAIVASSDVKDIVGTKADLNTYDTTTLGDQDIIKVLADESQSGATTYYRWSATGTTFTLIGSEGPYYTKSQTDTLVNAKADASMTYTKSEVDTALNSKADNSTLANYATTTAMNAALASKADAPAAGTTYVTDAAMTTALASKADASTTYTKTQVDVALTGKADASTTYTKTEVDTALTAKADASSLAAVATSGSYNDLSNKPTIPTVNNATLTIQKNGTNVATFTANSSTNQTANIEVPVITMTTTDPGEGSPLAANNFIAVYSA